MCRRELDKAESEIKKNSSIIGDYKQVGPCTLELGRVLWKPCLPAQDVFSTPTRIPARRLALTSPFASLDKLPHCFSTVK